MMSGILCLIALLKPFYSATIHSSSSKTAFVAPWVDQLTDEVQEVETLGHRMMEAAKSKLIDQIKERFVLSDTHLFASAMHPTFSSLFFCSDSIKEAIKIRLRDEYDRYHRTSASATPTTATTSSARSPFTPKADSDEDAGLGRMLKRRRLASRQAELAIAPEKDDFDLYFEVNLGLNLVNPIVWWRENRERFPKMVFLARKYLCIPSTSVASERIFSFSEGVATDKRDRLAPAAIGDIVFSHYALKFLTSFHSQ